MNKGKIIFIVFSLLLVYSASSQSLNYTLESSTCPAEDQSGNNFDGSCVNPSNITQEIDGQVNLGWDFGFDPTSTSGIDGGYVDLGDQNALDFTTGSVTFALWAKTDDPQNRKMDVIAKWNNDNHYIYRLNEGKSDGIGFWFGGSKCFNDVTIDSSWSDNTWHHHAVTYDGSKAKVWFDGVNVANRTCSNAAKDSTDNTYVGARPGSGNHFDGKLDQVIMDNTSYSASQIKDLADNEAVYSSSSSAPPNVTVEAPKSISYTGDPDLNVYANQSIVSWTRELDGSNSSFTPNTTLSVSSGLHDLTVYAENSNGDVGKDSVSFTVEQSSDQNVLSSCGDLKLWHTFDNTTAYDASSCNNAGVIQGSPKTGLAGIFDESWEFDGVDDYVEIDDASELNPSNVTISQFFKVDSNTGGTQVIFEKGNPDGSSTPRRIRTYLNDFSGTFRAGFRIYDGSWHRALTSEIKPGEWYHLTAVYNGTHMKIYNNGTLDNTTALSSMPTVDGQIHIGSKNAEGSTGNFFTGKIEDVQLYNKVLNQSQINQLKDDNTALVNTKKSKSISLNSPDKLQVFQRNSTGKGQIVVDGSYSGNPNCIEANFAGRGWENLSCSVSGGSFRYLMNESVGQGNLQVRFSNSTSTNTSVGEVGVGDVIVLSGQSNMEMRGELLYNYSAPNGVYNASFYDLSSEKIRVADDPLFENTQNMNTQYGSAWPLFAADYVANQSVPIQYIPAACGGTSILQWQPSYSGSVSCNLPSKYSNPFDMLNTSIVSATSGTGDIGYIYWFQGESDTGSNSGVSTRSDYKSNFNLMSSEANKAVDGTPEWVVGQIDVGFDRTYHNEIRLAQKDLWSETGYVVPGPVTYNLSSDFNSNPLHFHNDSEIKAVEQYWLKSVKGALGFHDGRGPDFQTAYTDDNKTLNVVFDESLNTNAVLDTGAFTVRRSGSKLSVSSVGYYNSSTVQVNLSSQQSSTPVVSLGDKSDSYKERVPVSQDTGQQANVFISKSVSYKASDTTPPTTSDNWSSTGFVDKSDVTVSLTATDSASSVANISYRVDSGAWTDKSGSSTTVSFSGDGTYNLDYNATDSKGNVESTQSETIKLDATAPSVGYNPSSTDAGTTSNDWIFVNVSASDATSGLQTTKAEVGGTNYSFSTTSGNDRWLNLTSLSDGSYDVYGWGKDNAGNFKKTSTRTVTIDTPETVTAEYIVDTQTDWQQGTFKDSSSFNTFLNITYGPDGDGSKDITYVGSTTEEYAKSYSFGLGRQVRLTPSFSSFNSISTLSDAYDFDSDGQKEIGVLDGNNNLRYYDFSDDSLTDTNIDSSLLGFVSDVDSDGNNDLIFGSSDIDYYTASSSSITNFYEYSLDSVDYISDSLDCNNDGSPEIAVKKGDGNAVMVNSTGSSSQCYFEDIGSGSIGGAYDYNNDGVKEITIADMDIDNNLAYMGESSKTEIQASINSPNYLSETVDIGGDGDFDIVMGPDLRYYDDSFGSVKDISSVSEAYDMGGVYDFGYYSQASYQSKTFNESVKMEWTNFTVKGLNRPGSSEVNITFQLSSDGFSTIKEEKTFTSSELTSGNTYDFNFNDGSEEIRFNISMGRGPDTPSLDRIEVQGKNFNRAPTVNDQRIKWEKIGAGTDKQVEYGISDPDGSEIASRNTPSNAAVTKFTNSSYIFNTTNTSLDYSPEITDQLGLTSPQFTTQMDVDLKHLYAENSTGVFNESRQTVNTTLVLDNTGNNTFYTFTDSPPSVLISTVQDADVTSGSSIGNTKKEFVWEYYVDHIETKTFSTEKDTSKDSTIDQQHVVRNKQVKDNWSTGYSSLKVDSVSPSIGSCSNCNQRSISISGNSVKNVSFNASGDFLENEKEFDFSPDTDSVTLGVNYLGNRKFQINETSGFDWNGINITGNVTEPVQCSQNNASTVDVSGSSFSNTSVEFQCDPGSIGNPTQDVNNISGGDRVWINSTDMVISSNETSETEIAIRTEKDQWQYNGVYDGGSLEAYVEGVYSGNTSELNVTDTGSYFRIEVGGIQNSTLYTDDSDWSITYTNTEDGDPVSGGGGGGGGSDPSTDAKTVYFGQDNQPFVNYSIDPGETVVKQLTLVNTADRDVTVNLRRGAGQQCKYFDVQQSLNSDEYGATGAYQVAKGNVSDLSPTRENRVNVGVRISIPNGTEGSELLEQGVVCDFETISSYGSSEDLKVGVSNSFGISDFIELVLDWLDTPLFDYPESFSFSENGEVKEEGDSKSFTVGNLILVVTVLAILAWFVNREI